jgi:hypothetical protein
MLHGLTAHPHLVRVAVERFDPFSFRFGFLASPDSFSLDARGLDDGPPLLNLGLLESAQRLGSLLLAWRNTLSEIGESLTHHSPT